ncbi:hypothetical protein DPMN_094879 [Dreissena polymorpha]|uniref:Uncharacterized protein n=1 Tax=Dreissena polymorpha TaxID=45954 RepID=A0A9D4R320_DREPO|nr:hypothetical protein DPMN_094879 [Dreissena polymorpha]
MKYMEIVRGIAHRKPGLSFAFYDNQFRKARETSPLPWDRLHTEFWLMAVTFPSNHVSTQPFRSSRTGNDRKATGTKRFLENTCWHFNKLSGCRSHKLLLPHVCGYCRGPHTAFNCGTSVKNSSFKNPPNHTPKPNSQTKSGNTS